MIPVEVGRDPERLARLQREAQLLATLQHPHLASVYGFDAGPNFEADRYALYLPSSLEDQAERREIPVSELLKSLEPHRLCTYLYELAEAYSTFYQQCPVLKAGDDATRRSRLRICSLVGRVMADGLSLLGIEAPRRMCAPHTY